MGRRWHVEHADGRPWTVYEATGFVLGRYGGQYPWPHPYFGRFAMDQDCAPCVLEKWRTLWQGTDDMVVVFDD